MHHKNELTRARKAIRLSMGLRLGVGSFVNNDTVPLKGHTVRPPTVCADRGVRTADCGRRSTVIVASED